MSQHPLAAPLFVTADEVWIDGWRGASLLRVEGATLEWVGGSGAQTEAPAAHIPGTVFAGFTDSHVHLGLVDDSALVAGGLARVVDLGFDLAEVQAARERGESDASAVGVDFAGALITCPGGYPSDRSWAPASWVRQVATPVESAAAIAEMAGAGASRIKITLNSVGAPVFTDDMLAAVVAQAHAVGLPVVAHAEGDGQAARAAAAGVDVLAHTPWTERLGDDDIALLAGSVAVTSTLDIHGYGDPTPAHDVALDNLTRFAAAGGRVLYGTDLGNGPLPLGINPREISALAAAGLGGDGLARALVPGAASAKFVERISWIPGVAPTDPGTVASWYSSASVLAVSALKETFQ